MADLPILFSAPMVRAILREIEQPGTGKTQTRRALRPLPRRTIFFDPQTAGQDQFQEPRFAVGDRLWVRESHHRTNDSERSHLVGYDFADGPITRENRHHVEGVGDVQFFRHSLGGWGGRTSKNYPGIHMPRWASRLTLAVTDVRVQRLQEIDEADAIAEGLEHDIDGDVDGDGRHVVIESWRGADYLPWLRDPIEAYTDLWDQLNEARGYGWDANPWVAAYTFTPALCNIDQVTPCSSATPDRCRSSANVAPPSAGPIRPTSSTSWCPTHAPRASSSPRLPASGSTHARTALRPAASSGACCDVNPLPSRAARRAA